MPRPLLWAAGCSDDGFYYTEPSVLRKVMAAIRNSAK